ncbi:MAG: primosomal protein N' [Selenomonadaceae bacterium]|nr:primosomal protein N' [Selenomonadaceae bacterium]
MLVAQVFANVKIKSVQQTYTYSIPEHLKFLSAGWRVYVPFGKQKVDGFVMSVEEVPDVENFFDFELKDIIDVFDDEAWFTEEMIKSAKFISDFYLCSMSEAMTLFMPGRNSRKIKKLFERIIKLAENFSEEDLKKITSKSTKISILMKNLIERKEIPSVEVSKMGIYSPQLKMLEELNLIEIEQRRILRDSYSNVYSEQKNFELTAEQTFAIDSVKKFLQEKIFQGFLLHGVTGSGKTQVYIELTKIVRRLGRRAIILVPEIALTGQIVYNFKAYFPDIAVIHSRISIEEKADIFHKIREGKIGIVIGARSALFTPIENVGLIVVDEEQDFSYKQDTFPRYHARVVAEQFAKFYNAAVVFGSATPSFENFHRAKIGELIYLPMLHRVFNQSLPEVECIDMRGELRAGNKKVLSRDLQNLLSETLKNHQQAILLLNRRGYHTFVMCRSCGEVIKCPDCGLSMTYHADETLKCHHCEIEKPVPKTCPKCGSKYIKFFGTGTQKLEQQLNEILPGAKILRMDRDTTSTKFGHRKILNAFGRGEYDILFGTQMVAKGHDIQNVTAVGILSADSALNFADFRASEICFNLITQAAGRAGRANFPGKVIVQTYNTNADAIIFGCRQDYENFYNHEIKNREEFFFPPFSRLVKILFMSKNENEAKIFAEEIAEAFKISAKKFSPARQEILGPIPAVIENLKGVHRFVVLIKSGDLNFVRTFLLKYDLHKMPEVQIDFDPSTTN